MSLDTKYRPTRYSDVLGQETTIQVLKSYVRKGSGFHQSYLIAGPWGSGKTTLGRILARALLCAEPVEGEPCDKCPSCESMLRGSSEAFVEIDAATNSGKDSVRKITDDIQFATFSGKQKIHLFDESHRLSADALDALLKPMEENVPGTEDKQLICIFCTTEPERMKATILSRCAPAFVIRPVTPAHIGERLARVCDQEKISYDLEALTLIGELTECHIRDALKAIEGVSNLGVIDRANVSSYMHLDVYGKILEVLGTILTDLPLSLSIVEKLLDEMSPSSLYERFGKMAMLAFRASLGPVSIPSYLDTDRVMEIGTSLGGKLLQYAERFSVRPGHPSAAMLLCDVAQLNAEANRPTVFVSQFSPTASVPVTIKSDEKTSVKSGEPTTVDGVYVHPRAVKAPNEVSTVTSAPPAPPALKPLEFFRLVKIRADELEVEKSGRPGQDHLGSPGANQSG